MSEEMLYVTMGGQNSSQQHQKEDTVYASMKFKPCSKEQSCQELENSKDKAVIQTGPLTTYFLQLLNNGSEFLRKTPLIVAVGILLILCLVFLITTVVLRVRVQQQKKDLDILIKMRDHLQHEISSIVKALKSTGNWTCIEENCYHFSAIKKSWPNCVIYCRELGYDMLKIDSKDERVAMESKANHFHWIGLSYKEGTWKWQDGSLLSKDINFSVTSGDGHCAFLSPTRISAIKCSSTYSCMCERNALPTKIIPKNELQTKI
ncbi:killer cell lectin-like receptor subfamily B member 1B allele B [Ornithorhynchus anatinus]|uniref:C-type lectin domain-containing protein n=1 Tax=Ornithorhynchus anatinus TaxID=9258 RepID=A0A6I8P3H4_ORNAN|nr:killer cell lectin-like receptor subfamily B member 1B allele B [Ornithorhynchus anatinus]